MEKGFAGRIAEFFINSKLTILLMIALMIIGVYSSTLIPREEEPQIIVPMADVMVGYPGASPAEVENRVVKPLEKIISNIKGVEHVHSMAMNGRAMIIVQFYVGQDTERSYVKLYDELMKNKNIFPKGVYEPMVKTRSIDDVPMLGLTLWSEKYNDYQLRQIADELSSEIKKTKDVAVTKIVGGRNRVVRITIDKDRMGENGVDALSIIQMIQAGNVQSQTGSMIDQDQEFLVTTGNFLSSKEDIGNLVVGINHQMPVYLRQVATIADGPASPSSYVSFGYGNNTSGRKDHPGEYPAVTISIAKVKGADAMKISEKILGQVLKENRSMRKNIVIATGAEPSSLPGVTVDEKIVVTSTGALTLGKIPKKLVVIGAGVIGLEMGSVYARLGSEVTVVEYLDAITPGMDAEIAKTFERTLKKQGFKFVLGAAVQGVNGIGHGERSMPPATTRRQGLWPNQ